MAITEEHVLEALKNVIDPELFVNIVDLGLIYVVDLKPGENEKSNVIIDMTMTSPACPAGPQLIANSKQVIERMEGVDQVEVRIVMDPPVDARSNDRRRTGSTRHLLGRWRRAADELSPRRLSDVRSGTAYLVGLRTSSVRRRRRRQISCEFLSTNI